MAPLVEDVQQKSTNLFKDKSAKTDLERDVTGLTQLLDAGNLDATDDAGARYFRALAQGLVSNLRKEDGMPTDTAALEQALSDMDRVIAGKHDIPAWSITIPNVEYYAGDIAWWELRSGSRAYSYWRRCADSGHAGCMSCLANAYTFGMGVTQADPVKALDLSIKVFKTGTKYECAGASGAVNVAWLIYFTGTSFPKDNDPVSWMQKSYALSDTIEARPNKKDACGGSGARIEEFLFRLARADRQNDLLHQAAQHLSNDSSWSASLIKYFSGSLDVKGFESAVDSNKLAMARCGAYFDAMWYAYLIRDTALVNKFYQPLLKFDQIDCPFGVFAKKFHPEAPQVQPPAP